LNRLSNTISIINTTAKAVTSEIPVGTDPTPPTIKAGRGFLYDAKLSGSGTGSCASCHVDADMDKLAWNLGDPTQTMSSVYQNGTLIQFHPMKGPMTTQTLRGLINMSPYHWRGDKPDFAAFNGAFGALLGGPQLSDADMAAYTNYVNTILFLPNPYEKLNRTLPTSFQGANPVNGEQDFITIPGSLNNLTCNSCHVANPGPGSNRLITLHHVQPLKIPQTRNMYQKQMYYTQKPTTIDGFGMDHDGRVDGFKAFFSTIIFPGYTPQQFLDMGAYMMCFDTGTAPAVGYTRTLTVGTLAGAQSDWATLESQAGLGNNDLIARGTIQGQVHGLLYQPSTSNYMSDTGTTYTHAQVQALVAGGDTLSVMGVYPGTGTTH
jgi:YVTN family beta-propeller protein